jgi:hypothetical protein
MQKIETSLIDDVDGSEASETITFSLDGKDYEIDLSNKNAAKLRTAIAKWTPSARQLRAPRAGRKVDPAQATAIRTWARANGLVVGDRGRIPVNVTQAFHDR